MSRFLADACKALRRGALLAALLFVAAGSANAAEQASVTAAELADLTTALERDPAAINRYRSVVERERTNSSRGLLCGGRVTHPFNNVETAVALFRWRYATHTFRRHFNPRQHDDPRAHGWFSLLHRLHVLLSMGPSHVSRFPQQSVRALHWPNLGTQLPPAPATSNTPTASHAFVTVSTWVGVVANIKVHCRAALKSEFSLRHLVLAS